MAGFLKFAIPFGEVGGRYLEQQGALSDARKNKAAKDAAFAALIHQLHGGAYDKIGPYVSAGGDPSAAFKIAQEGELERKRDALEADLKTAGGKWNTDLLLRAFRLGDINAKEINQLLVESAGGSDADAATRALGALLANTTDPARKAELQALVPVARTDPKHILSLIEKSVLTPERPRRPFELVDKNTGAPMFYSGTGPIPPTAVPAQVYATMHRAERPSEMQKFLAQPIGLLKGHTVLQSSGEPFRNPIMTVDEAVKAGGVLVTDKAATSIANSLAAEKNLDILDRAGALVLPANVPSSLRETVKDIGINPAARYFKAKVDPTFAGYEHAKAGIITYVRDLAKVGRINQSELRLIIDRLNNAQTYPALKSATDTARRIIRQDREAAVKAGRLDVGPSKEPSYGDEGLIENP